MNNYSLGLHHRHYEKSTKSPSVLSSKSTDRQYYSKNSTIRSSFSGKKAKAKAQIDELLQCIICFGRVSNPQMCPSCSNLCCYSCIRRWLTERKSECPHCRCSLRVSQLINCKLVTDLALAVETYEGQKKEEKKTVDHCQTHNLEYYYFCQRCQVPLCSDCAMFGTEHKGHEFQHVSKVYEKQVDAIKIEQKGLKDRLYRLLGDLSAIEENIMMITEAKEKQYAKLVHAFELMSKGLESEGRAKLLALFEHKSSLKDEIDFLKLIEAQVDRQLNHPGKSKLVGKIKEMLKLLQEVGLKPLPAVKTDVSIQFASEVVPAYTQGEFQLTQYSSKRQSNEVIYSEPLSEYGMAWRLKIYPNGNGFAKGNYLSVFLEMIQGFDDPINYEYKVEMVNQREPEVIMKIESTSAFENGKCWGHTKFFKIDLLESEGYLAKNKDTLVFRYSVRAPSYEIQSLAQQRYILSLEENSQQSNLLIQELKKKIREEQENSERLTISTHHNTTRMTENHTEEKNIRDNLTVLTKRRSEAERRNEEEKSNRRTVDLKHFGSSDFERISKTDDEILSSRRKTPFIGLEPFPKSQEIEQKEDSRKIEDSERESDSDGIKGDSYDNLFNKEEWLESRKTNLPYEHEFLREGNDEEEEDFSDLGRSLEDQIEKYFSSEKIPKTIKEVIDLQGSESQLKDIRIGDGLQIPEMKSFKSLGNWLLESSDSKISEMSDFQKNNSLKFQAHRGRDFLKSSDKENIPHAND